MTAREFVAWMDGGQSRRDQEDRLAKQRAQEDAEDRYFDELSDLVEKHPVVSPRVIRNPLRT